jgi:hypothetical protein
LLEQQSATPELLTRLVLELLANQAVRERMQAALAQWHTPDAAAQIADEISRSAGIERGENEAGGELLGQSSPHLGTEEPGKISRA